MTVHAARGETHLDGISNLNFVPGVGVAAAAGGSELHCQSHQLASTQREAGLASTSRNHPTAYLLIALLLLLQEQRNLLQNAIHHTL